MPVACFSHFLNPLSLPKIIHAFLCGINSTLLCNKYDKNSWRGSWECNLILAIMIGSWRRVIQPWASPHMSFTWLHFVCPFIGQLWTIIGWLGEYLSSAWSHLATMKVACLRTNMKLTFRRRESCKHCRETEAEGSLTNEVTLKIMPQFKAFSS